MEVPLAVLQLLLIVLFGVLKACLELKGSGKEEDDRHDAHDDDHRPKHLKG